MPHLLLVDDDDLFRESLGLNLIDEGYDVTSFANGRDVLAYLDQGGGEQEPITLNILYWRQDLLSNRLSFYVGKLHPNQHISLSLFNNDERTQFLNGENDGDLAIAVERCDGVRSASICAALVNVCAA